MNEGWNRGGRRRIETLNSLLNQKVNWKSGELGLPAETDREEGGREGPVNECDRGGRMEEMWTGREQRLR